MKSLFLAALLAVCPALLQAAVTDQLVGHWRFDETSGTTVANSFGASSSGTLNNFPAAPWVGGRIGGALDFDGANDWVRVASYVTPTNKMTISMWVWADSRPAWASFAKNWGGTTSSQFYFGLNASDGDVSTYITAGSGVVGPARENAVLPIGSWQHVAMTCDGSTVRVFRNGVRVGTTQSYSGSIVSTLAPFAFGVRTDVTGNAPNGSSPGFWDGKMDDAGLWTRALSDSEIYGIYTAGNAGLDLEQSTPTPPPGPIVCISEFMAANSGGLQDEDGNSSDWIEIYNGLDTPVNLAGWRLTDDLGNLSKWVFPATTIAARSYLVVFASGKNCAVAGQQLHTNFSLAAGGEPLALINPAGQIVSSFPSVSHSTNVSYGTARPANGAETPGSAGFNALLRYFPTPTPGATNGSGVEALGPIVSDLAHTPALPVDADNLAVTVRVTAAFAPVASVTLNYRVMYGTEQTLAMADDGAHGDGAAGDGVFGASIPASAGTPGQMVRYYVTATDTAAKSSRWPLYVTAAESPQYQGTVIANTAVSTPLPVLQWFVQDTAAAETSFGTTCSVFYLGEFYDNVDVRLRGGTSASWPKKSFKLKFNDGYHFRFQTDVGRVDEVNLNATYTDKSYNRSVLTYEAMRDGGLPTPEIFHVHVRQNGLFYSVALMTEQIDKDFLDRWDVPDSGALYKGGPGSTLASTTGFEKKTRTEESNADLTTLIANLALTGSALETFVFDEVDVPGMVNYMAGIALTQDTDGSDKNYYLYRDTEGTREWRMLPYDLDLTFGPSGLNTDTIVYNLQNVAGAMCQSHPFLGARPYVYTSGKYNRLLEAIVNAPRARAMLLRRLRSLTDTQLATPKLFNRIDALNALIGNDVLADRAKWGSNAHFGGTTYTLLQANDRIKNEYLTPRLGFLTGTGIVDVGATNPASQPAAPAMNFVAIEFFPASGNQAEEYVTLTNPNAFAVDLTGWTIEGEIEWAFKAGTVVLPGESLYLTPDAAAFRARTVSPKGGEKRFVQGGYSGQLSARGGTLNLKNSAGTIITTTSYTGAPTVAQENLRITEVNYAPAAGGSYAAGEYEFIELRNLGGSALSLAGVTLSGGVDFDFTGSAITTLAPGAYALVVKNSAAFISRYGSGLPVAGQFIGALDNSGDRIHLTDASGENVLDFTYQEMWQPLTDAAGYTLTAASDAQPYTQWDLPAGWKPSGKLHGTPGAADAAFDTDGDGIPDLWESQHTLAPANAADASQGPDADGATNRDEYLANTNPRDVTSRFCVGSITHDAGNVVHISFAAAAGRTYAIQRSVNLSDAGGWMTIFSEPAGAARNVAFAETPVGPQQYYRVVTPAP